ncbi:hypothetical protein ACWGLC_16050 [Dietzia sp. NPDC055877]
MTSEDPVLARAEALGAAQIQARTYRQERDQALRALSRICAAYDHGTDLDLDVTIRQAVDLLNKERP